MRGSVIQSDQRYSLVRAKSVTQNDSEHVVGNPAIGRDRLGVTLPDDAGDVIAVSLNQRDGDFTATWMRSGKAFPNPNPRQAPESRRVQISRT
jgi:hypothetical protein